MLNSMLLTTLFVIIAICPSAKTDAPPFNSSFGINVLSYKKLNDQLFEVTVSSDAVQGDWNLRVLFPNDYQTSGSQRRYPVVYLLHGAGCNYSSWTTNGGEAQQILSGTPIIAVMPDTSRFGWYTNWINPGDAAPQNWRTFHMEQLVPWIDDNVRSVKDKFGRAIGGFSMGGYGVIRYAELYSEHFAYAVSFSGAVHLLDYRLPFVMNWYMLEDNKPLDGPFGPALPPEFGYGWIFGDTALHAAQLRNVSVALYTGNVGAAERVINELNYRMRDALVAAGLPFYFNDYGNGTSIGGGCKGHHEWPCWNAALRDVLPRMMAVLKQEP